jgi:hypothetical protein
MTTKKVSEVTNDPPPVHIPIATPDNDRPLWIAIRSALLGIVSTIETYKLGMVCKHVKLTGRDE